MHGHVQGVHMEKHIANHGEQRVLETVDKLNQLQDLDKSSVWISLLVQHPVLFQLIKVGLQQHDIAELWYLWIITLITCMYI